MAKYHTDEAPRVVASIAQRVSIKEKIELSIMYVPLASIYFHFVNVSSLSVGKRKYWKMLLKCAVFRSHTVQVYLQVIRKDVITIWNFNDPHQYLMDDNIIGALLCTDKPVGTPAAPPNT
ncbi:hypothetical protein JVT61DRAFT_12508 [Boletus reticuloceps]|uniref:Uncharacterized protein n=1 Tax=Boletus reticuloceps TaxID=495285 RepID=A0A8I2YDS6_9AGAM|nr:hypothetical protein JVT61DRAFT_12508 [Boletus reticuloceps]